MAKTYSDTYLFRQYNEYEKYIYEFILKAERIDTSSEEFKDILYDIKKRRISDNLAKVITSENVVIGMNPGRSLPKAFKVFVAADVKDKSKVKVFIDVSEIIAYKNSVYICNRLDWLVSYIVSGINNYIYVKAENKFLGNASILKDGCTAWVSCFNYIIDRIYKTTTVVTIDRRIKYLSAIYYQVALMCKDINRNYDTIIANAIKVSGIDIKDARIVDILIKDGDFANIDLFTKTLGRIINLKDIKTAVIVQKWTEAFGTGTIFALEYLPAFLTMMTNTYIGAYLDQQMTIEKVAGQSMVKLSKTLLQIGASV